MSYYADTTYFDPLKIEWITLKNRSDNKSQCAFSNIKIIDKRYDSSAIGYIKSNRYGKTEYLRLVTNHGLSTDLEVFLKNTYKNDSSAGKFPLVIILRRFWFYRDYGTRNTGNLQNNKIDFFMNLSVDCFLHLNNTFIPFVRQDTIVQTSVKLRHSDAGTIIVKSLQAVFDTMFVLHKPDISSNKKRITAKELHDGYDKLFHKSILKDQVLKKGVYMNFAEFRENSPSQVNFDIRKTQLADDIYLIDGKDTLPSGTAWGYCDGKNSYIKAGRNLFKLNKQGNTFSIIGTKNLRHIYKGPGIFTYDDRSSPGVNLAIAGLQSLIAHDKVKLDLVPMQLDIETGELY